MSFRLFIVVKANIKVVSLCNGPFHVRLLVHVKFVPTSKFLNLHKVNRFTSTVPNTRHRVFHLLVQPYVTNLKVLLSKESLIILARGRISLKVVNNVNVTSLDYYVVLILSVCHLIDEQVPAIYDYYLYPVQSNGRQYHRSGNYRGDNFSAVSSTTTACVTIIVTLNRF